jgi:hypothetical protein
LYLLDIGKQMPGNLNFFAGKKALPIIREKGLQPDDVKVMAGAAGGPKWLVLGHLDRAIFSSWFNGRTQPLFLVGASSGAWRFSAAAQANPRAAIDRLEEAYIHQHYEEKPNPEEVSAQAMRILEHALGENRDGEILSHPFIRMNIMTVLSRGPLASDRPSILGPGLAGAAICNLIHRRGIRFFFHRSLFYDPRDQPPFFHMNEFPIRKTALHKQNIKKALLASGSIPWVMSGVDHIPGASQGVHRDGALIDYHLDIPFIDDNGIVLYPHFNDRIIPGWLDKKLPWRKPSPRHTAHMLLVSPTRSFIDRLPYGKIPDRKDFYRFAGDDWRRFDYWKKAVELSKFLADEFMDAVHTDGLRKCVKPMRSNP